MFLHADFELGEFYARRQYVNFTKEGKEEELFFNWEDKEEDEVLPFAPTP